MFERCVCEEKAGHEMNGYFCSSVTFLTRLSVSVLILKLASSEYAKQCQIRNGILDLNCVDFVRKASTFKLSLITVCNLKMLCFLENTY